MWFCLIPVCHTCHIILSLEESSVSHTDLLDRHFQILIETDRILNMPAVKTSHRHTVIIVIEIVNQLIVR